MTAPRSMNATNFKTVLKGMPIRQEEPITRVSSICNDRGCTTSETQTRLDGFFVTYTSAIVRRPTYYHAVLRGRLPTLGKEEVQNFNFKTFLHIQT